MFRIIQSENDFIHTIKQIGVKDISITPSSQQGCERNCLAWLSKVEIVEIVEIVETVEISKSRVVPATELPNYLQPNVSLCDM